MGYDYRENVAFIARDRIIKKKNIHIISRDNYKLETDTKE